MRLPFTVAHGLLLAVAFASAANAEERVVMSYPLVLPEPTHRIVAVDAAKREARIERAEGAMFSIPAEGQAVLVVPSKPGLKFLNVTIKHHLIFYFLFYLPLS